MPSAISRESRRRAPSRACRRFPASSPCARPGTKASPIRRSIPLAERSKTVSRHETLEREDKTMSEDDHDPSIQDLIATAFERLEALGSGQAAQRLFPNGIGTLELEARG